MEVTNPADENIGETAAANDPMTQRLMIEAPDASSVRFLHVLQGADAGASAAATSVVTSSAGDAFEGVAVNGVVVMFPVDSGLAFGGTTYAAPAGTTTHYITGLTPGAAYTATVTPSGSGITVILTPDGPLTADAGGVLVVQ